MSEPPFTYRAYRSMLETARATHAVTSFARFDGARPRTLILRHDVDYTLDGVLRFAHIEAELGCTATYLFRVHAEYNPFAAVTVRTMRDVEALGHEVGLHFECMNMGRALRMEPLELLRREKAVLETILGHPIRTCSEHRELSGVVHGTPTFDAEDQLRALGFEYYAMDPRWSSAMKYLSDSNAVWREGDPTRHLAAHDRLQVLVHADWWFDEDLLLKGPYFHGTQA